MRAKSLFLIQTPTHPLDRHHRKESLTWEQSKKGTTDKRFPHSSSAPERWQQTAEAVQGAE